MRSALPYVVASLELSLALVGAVLLWRLVIGPRARAEAKPAQLPPWNAALPDFLAFLMLVVGGSMLAAIAAVGVGKFLSLRGDEVTVFNGAAAQLGLLGGVLAHRLAFRAPPSAVAPPPPPVGSVLRSGAATFLMALPVLIASAKAWEIFLRVCGLPTEKQDLIGMFANAKSPWLLTSMILLAVAIAPLAEELVFRAGLFRYFRTRMPHAIAVVVPAIFFACLHVNWVTLQGLSSLVPLIVLACIFSLAYERTGHIGTPIVAHALFNLNTVILIFAGVGV